MQREREVRPPERKVGQERPDLPLSASFLGQEAYFLTSFPETWGISVLGVFARSVLAGQGLHGCWPCKSFCCSLVAQLCPALCSPMNCSTPGFPVLHYLLELAQTHVHRVSDAIQPSHSLFPPFPPALNLSQHQVCNLWSGFWLNFFPCSSSKTSALLATEQ